MKKLTVSLLATLAMAATTFAGHEVYATSNGKDKNVIPPTCFNDRELQVDLFGVYGDGNAASHAGPIQDHEWGGGVGVNYFFTRNIGVGAEYFAAASRRNNDQPGVSNSNNNQTTFHNVNGSLIFRLPIDRICLAPYAYVGGGAVIAGKDWADVFVGIGAEYRIVPHKVGLFVDARWTYFGDRFGDGDQNNFLGRAGVKLVF